MEFGSIDKNRLSAPAQYMGNDAAQQCQPNITPAQLAANNTPEQQAKIAEQSKRLGAACAREDVALDRLESRTLLTAQIAE